MATIVAGWDLGDDWRLDGALRYAYGEAHAGWYSRWSPSIVLRVPVTERFEVHAEWFGSYTQGLVADTQQQVAAERHTLRPGKRRRWP